MMMFLSLYTMYKVQARTRVLREDIFALLLEEFVEGNSFDPCGVLYMRSGFATCSGAVATAFG